MGLGSSTKLTRLTGSERTDVLPPALPLETDPGPVLSDDLLCGPLFMLLVRVPPVVLRKFDNKLSTSSKKVQAEKSLFYQQTQFIKQINDH